MTMDGERLGVRLQPPHMGEHTNELLSQLGYTETDLADLRARQVVA